MFKPYKEIKPLNKRKPKFIYPDGTKHFGEILDEIEIERPPNKRNKVYKYLIQKIKWDWEGDPIEFRICYYYYDLNNENTNWIFGESALTLNKSELLLFIEMMKEKGWI